MSQKFTTTMERIASLEMDVRNFRSEVAGRFDGVERGVNDLRDNHIHVLQERVDSHQKLLYGAVLAALGNIVVSLLVK